MAGDSGGGITVFELQHGAAGAAGGSASVDGTAAAPAAGGGGKREDRSQPAGRWMTSGERPVLSLAHARVPSSAAPDTAVDFIATGDTGGTVTVWEFLPGGGSGVLAPMAGANLRQGASDVRGGFVHRGPAGKRRGGNGMSAEGEEAGEPPPCPGLVPVLAYRAHQVKWAFLCFGAQHAHLRNRPQRDRISPTVWFGFLFVGPSSWDIVFSKPRYKATAKAVKSCGFPEQR